MVPTRQGFGTVIFYPVDPNLLDTDPHDAKLKYKSGKFIYNTSDNKILLLWKYIVKNVQYNHH